MPVGASGVPSPTTVAAGGTPPPGCIAPPFCELIDIAALEDVARLKPTITNTLEVGYKGLLGGDILIGVNGWWSHITDFTSALRLASPNLFLNGNDIGAYLTGQFLPLVGVLFPDAATAQATAAQLAGLMAAIPLGTVTPRSSSHSRTRSSERARSRPRSPRRSSQCGGCGGS